MSSQYSQEEAAVAEINLFELDKYQTSKCETQESQAETCQNSHTGTDQLSE